MIMKEILKLFLHLELRPWQQSSYEKPLLSFASSLSGNLIGAEMDNQSDSTIADLVIKLSAQTEKIFVLIQAEPQETFGSTLKLLNVLLRNEHQIHTVILSGNNEKAEKLLSTLGDRYQKESDLEKIKERIREFALA
jgi:uncharacterized Fe-S cluster-containing radical SAM superfamily protein